MKPKIKPLTTDCNYCGNLVTDHHWLCNKCWNDKTAESLRSFRRELNKNEQKAWKALTKKEKYDLLKKQGRIINA